MTTPDIAEARRTIVDLKAWVQAYCNTDTADTINPIFALANAQAAELERLRAQVAQSADALRLMLRGTQADCGRITIPSDEAVRAAFAALATSPAAPAQQAEPMPCIRARCITHGCDGFCERRARDAQQAEPLMLNGLTESETSATASVSGMVGEQGQAAHDNAILERGIQLGMYREQQRAAARAEQAAPSLTVGDAAVVPLRDTGAGTEFSTAERIGLVARWLEGRDQELMARICRTAATELKAVAAVKPYGWLYDWTHSSALGKPDEEFTGFTTDESYARSREFHHNVRACYLAPQFDVEDLMTKIQAFGLACYLDTSGEQQIEMQEEIRAALSGAAKSLIPAAISKSDCNQDLAAQPAAQGVDERAAFEAWLPHQTSPLFPHSLRKDEDGCYDEKVVQAAWWAWKHRAALAQAPTAEEQP